MPRRPELTRTTLLAVVALVATGLVLVGPVRGAGESAVKAAAAAWRGVFEDRPRAAFAQRMIVVLSSPSLVDRMSEARESPSADDQRRWVAEAEASQRLLISRLRERGIRVRAERTFTRTLNGFSALLDPTALAELERLPGVEGVYPVRTVYPATAAAEILSRPEFGPTGGRRAGVALPGFDGEGVTVALLDTGVDLGHPYLHGRVLPGVDVIADDELAAAEAKPDEPARLESHGTKMAGILVGAGGPAGITGVAPGVQVLPIRILGWERAADGNYAVLGRGDGLIAGLERAVDPDGDGDVEDAAAVALAAVVEPYAAFAESPEARAVDGAARLGTLVVAPAGNDGRAGRGFGSVGAPGGAPAALAVGALDTRRDLPTAEAAVRVGGRTVFDDAVRVLGPVAPREGALDLASLRGPTLADARRPASYAVDGTVLADFFSTGGVSRVADRAVLLSTGARLDARVRNAAAAGAVAVVVSGTALPPGALDLDEAGAIPVVAIPGEAGREAAAALARGETVSVELEPRGKAENDLFGGVAPFSSGGLAFDGRVKPDVVAPGVGIATADAGRNADGTPRFATATGTSVGAAVVAGAAALVAQARPGLTASELKSLLVGSAAPVTVDEMPLPVELQGAGLVDPGAATAAEVAVEPTGIPYGRVTADGWSARRTLAIKNLSTRRLEIGFGVVRDAPADDPELTFGASTAHLTLQPGASAEVTLTVSAPASAKGAAAGAFVVQPEGSRAVRVPWALSFRPLDGDEPLVTATALSDSRFAPSNSAPAVLAFRAGRVLVAEDGTRSVEPVALLEAELWTAEGRRLGILARLRDLLPGRYAFGLTGRDPGGAELAPGDYELRLRAVPVGGNDGAGPTTASVPFTITD